MLWFTMCFMKSVCALENNDQREYHISQYTSIEKCKCLRNLSRFLTVCVILKEYLLIQADIEQRVKEINLIM